MLKQIATGLTLIISVAAFSQVGIGTENPHPSSELDLGAPDKALYLNRVANTAVIANPQEGMVIYDLEGKCVKAYQGNPAKWSECLSYKVGSITTLNCSSATFNPTSATQGTSYMGTLTIPYTGGNGGTYAAQSFTQNGLTFALPAGVFATGAGNLVYNITGTPTTAGTTSINVTTGGQSCNGLTLTVNQNGTGVLPNSITLSQNRRQWIASVYDTDYLPYTLPSGPATINVVNANGTPEAVTVDYQGSITTAGIPVRIPVANVTGSGNIGAWTSTFVVPAIYAQDNISRTLELSWAAQPYTSSTTYINATIKSLDGTFNAKKLDINAGIGSDYLGLLLGAFQYPYNNAGTLTSYEVRDIPGIPDRMFGIADNAGNANSHLMLYLPVQGEDGKIWLNNNLGADYSNLMNANFNLTKQATTDTDYLAYGSLFEWGRKGDGHELVTRTGPGNSQTTAVHPTVTGPLAEPLTTPGFINVGGTNPDWKTPAYDVTRWAGGSAPNNPCPHGFRVPNQQDQNTLADAVNAVPRPTNVVERSVLRFTRAGHRTPGNTQIGSFGYYFNSYSGVSGNLGYLSIVYGAAANTLGQGTSSMGLTNAASVRCIED